jgi:hypothetical protein
MPKNINLNEAKEKFTALIWRETAELCRPIDEHEGGRGSGNG